MVETNVLVHEHTRDVLRSFLNGASGIESLTALLAMHERFAKAQRELRRKI